ncbi:MAG: fatty acid desaturase [Cyanobium sp.]
MPYHAEHHLYPSVPFDALPRAHALLGPHLAHGDQGYLQVHRGFLMAPRLVALPAASAAPSAPSPAVIGTP